jgi:hypothetical protein
MEGHRLEGETMTTQLVTGKVKEALGVVSDCAQTRDCMNDPSMVDCARICLDCATVCAATAVLLARESKSYRTLCRVCADICDACAKECEKFDVEHCRVCARACRRCAEECRSLAA